MCLFCTSLLANLQIDVEFLAEDNYYNRPATSRATATSSLASQAPPFFSKWCSAEPIAVSIPCGAPGPSVAEAIKARQRPFSGPMHSCAATGCAVGD
jgi:hypothetical protein